jgi:hypothetical protein
MLTRFLPCERDVLSERAIRTPRSPVDSAGGGGNDGAGVRREAAAEMPSERMPAPDPEEKGPDGHLVRSLGLSGHERDQAWPKPDPHGSQDQRVHGRVAGADQVQPADIGPRFGLGEFLVEVAEPLPVRVEGLLVEEVEAATYTFTGRAFLSVSARYRRYRGALRMAWKIDATASR